MLKWILFDLNSFFASCEQQQHPELRGKPVAVVPSLTDSTCVIAASYEAKKFGIKTNTRVSEAKKMCPGLILKAGNHRLYTEFHHKIAQALEEVLPIKKRLSIDEFACELIGQEQVPERALIIAQKMKDHVRSVVGSEIKSSVGLGPNILIAKIASDLQKPDGLVAIPVQDIPARLGPLPIEVIPGVGRQMKIKLNAHGYFKISDLLKTPENELRKHWGNIWGLRIARELQGLHMAFRPETTQKSISHQHVLPPHLRTFSLSFQVATKLLMKGLVRMRSEKFKTKGLALSIKMVSGERYEQSVSFSDTDDTFFLNHQLKKLWIQDSSPLWNKKKPIKVAINLMDLVHGSSQLSFFDNPKTTQINQALDLINLRFGANTLFLAHTKDVIQSAKTRISFNHIPDLSEELDEADG
jgi:DNA polymerase-4